MTMKNIRHTLALLCALLCTAWAWAADYTTLLTPERGFTEVTSTDQILATADYCYLLAPAENTGLVVGVGRYEAKPDWAGEDTKALRYREATPDAVLDLECYFTIERSGQYIGLRNMAYSSSLFQTHDNAGYMYVLTYTEPTMSEWTGLTPTYQSEGYWLFESGKYPMSSNDWACGYLGPWNKVVAAGEPIALNRRNTEGDLAGHYRLFRIIRSQLHILRNEADVQRIQLLHEASPTNPVDATAFIVNPSFETGDEKGWTLTGKDPNGNDEFKTRDYGMSGKDGQYLMNAYQWWAPSLSVGQTVADVPSGRYRLSAVVATWEGRTVTFSANGQSATVQGQGDGTGIPVSLDIEVGQDGQLTIACGSTGQWWVEGHEVETQTFFKLDNVRLQCLGLTLNGLSIPLPNDATTRLQPDQWYYFDTPLATDYWLAGNLSGMVYSTEGNQLGTAVSTQAAQREMTLQQGRNYFRTSRSDASLWIRLRRTIQEHTFSATALNVDGLPQKIATIELNPDGPGADGTKLISQYLASKSYDLVGCSEDFNYNGSLTESLAGEYSWGTVRATLSIGDLPWSEIIRLKFRFDTDGLNLLWKNSTAQATNESWTQWNSMVETDGNQYVKKGFRHYDLQVSGSQTFDLYILHMDAGDTNATASRESQWTQLAAAINGADPSRPKLILGDTNSRWTRENIKGAFMDQLNAGLTMSDVWVEMYRGGTYPTTDMDDLTDQSDPTNFTNYEIVDKIIYINPTTAGTPRLVPQSFRIEQDYTYGNVQGTDNTKALGDHRPTVAEFKFIEATGDLANYQTVGDIDYDNELTANDVEAMVNIVLGHDNGATRQFDHQAADLDGNGEVNLADLTRLVNLLLKK